MGCRARERGREVEGQGGGARERVLGFARKQVGGILKEEATGSRCVFRACIS